MIEADKCITYKKKKKKKKKKNYPHNRGESAYLTHEDCNLTHLCGASHSFACHQVVSTIKLTFFDEPKKVYIIG